MSDTLIHRQQFNLNAFLATANVRAQHTEYGTCSMRGDHLNLFYDAPVEELNKAYSGAFAKFQALHKDIFKGNAPLIYAYNKMRGI